MKEVVAYVAQSHGYSQRRACSLTGQHRSIQCKPSRRDPRLEVRQRMREIARLQALEREHALLREEHELLKKAIRFCAARRPTRLPSSTPSTRRTG